MDNHDKLGFGVGTRRWLTVIPPPEPVKEAAYTSGRGSMSLSPVLVWAMAALNQAGLRSFAPRVEGRSVVHWASTWRGKKKRNPKHFPKSSAHMRANRD